MATSPGAFSTLDSGGGVQLVPPAGNQGPCQTCAAWAAAAAGSTAIATTMRVDASKASISVQALYFCGAGGVRDCNAGWTLQDALTQLQSRASSLPTASCLPYKPDVKGELLRPALCDGVCGAANEFMSQGSFQFAQITTTWAAQRAIRQYGGVVTRFDVYPDFRDAVAKAPKAVYKPGPGAKSIYAHAVLLVGYNNEQGWWLALNSWGSNWGDGGFFKVAFGECSVLTPGSSEAYAVAWTPFKTPPSRQLQVTAGSDGCVLYKAQPGDYLSRVAWLAKIPLDKFMADNTGTVKDLDAPLAGTQLRLCGAQQGSLNVLGGAAPGAAPAAGPRDTTAAQLAALLRVKGFIDTGGALSGWNKDAGANGGYCNFRGVYCTSGTKDVWSIKVWKGPGITGLKGTLPPAFAFAGLHALKSITISDQPGIGGTIPSDWSTLGQLEDVRVAENSLTGTLPVSFVALTRLKVFFAHTNKLSGPLPDAYKALTAMQNISLARNALTGSLPASWSSMTRLNDLGVNANKLSGPLPASWATYTAMESFGVASNHGISGTIPAGWAAWRKLKEVYFWDTGVSGCMPKSWAPQLAGLDVKLQVYDGSKISGFC